MKKNTKRAAVVGGVVAVVVGGGMAFAAFTTTGTIEAHGKVAQAAPLTADVADSSIAAGLYPGDCVDATIALTNPNPKAAVVDTSLYKDVSVQVNGGSDPYLVINPKVLSGAELPAGGTTFTVAAGGSKAINVPDLVCLDPKAGDSYFNANITVSGSVPFQLATGTEYAGK